MKLPENKRVFVVDTNIILNDATSIFELSENGKNLIVIPGTVLDELDSKKTGFEEINYQAREFSRLMEESFDLEEPIIQGQTTCIYSQFNDSGKYKNIEFMTVDKDIYDCDSMGIDPKNRNDAKIIEVAQWCRNNLMGEITFYSTDMYARRKAKAKSLQVDSWNVVEKIDNIFFTYHTLPVGKILKPSFSTDEIIELFCVDSFGLKLMSETGRVALYYKSGNAYYKIDENHKSLRLQHINMKNVQQKIMSSMMQDPYYDVVVSDSPAGSGKTLVTLSNAMHLLDTNRNLYDKIVYIRKTVISADEDLGYLKGDLHEKMSGFLAPLYSNLAFIVDRKYNNRKEKLSTEEMEEEINKLIERYGIVSMWEGHLRGTNIRNAILIIDECQNNTISSAKTILTRVADNCKAFILGSTRQIDNKYVNKHNNALTYLLNRSKGDNKKVNVGAINLEKTERSDIAEWADEF